ncbi:hypothetical protein TNCV_2261011 [Trichonephila clavipes]|nr:hypothetical protein TNCV_2261011 [Trichonephila clavipes]
MKKLVIMALYRSPLTVTLWPSSFLKKYGPMIPPAYKVHQTVSFPGCNEDGIHEALNPCRLKRFTTNIAKSVSTSPLNPLNTLYQNRWKRGSLDSQH